MTSTTPRPFMSCTILLLAAMTAQTANAQAKLALPRLVWDQPSHNAPTDLVRFKDQWFCVTREGGSDYRAHTEIRVLASADGVKWKSAALLKAATPRNLMHPRLAVNADGQLAVWALGAASDIALQFSAWHSKDGATFSDAEPVGYENHWLERPVWHKGTAYNFCHGMICGNAQTVRIASSPDGKKFRDLYDETFSGFFPDTGSLVFDGDTAICLFSRSGPVGVGSKGYLAVSKAPYRKWEWKETDRNLTSPRLIRMPDGKIIASVGVFDKGSRTVLCELDPAGAKLTEVLELPTGGATVFAGLALHEGQLWVSFHSTHEGRTGLYLAKVKRN